MSAGDIKLGILASEVTLPRAALRFMPSTIEIGSEDRAADGTLVSDIRAYKHHFEIPYNPMILGSNLDIIIGLYNLHVELNLIVDNETGADSTYTVVMRPLPVVTRELVRDVWLWSGASIILDEV